MQRRDVPGAFGAPLNISVDLILHEKRHSRTPSQAPRSSMLTTESVRGYSTTISKPLRGKQTYGVNVNLVHGLHLVSRPHQPIQNFLNSNLRSSTPIASSTRPNVPVTDTKLFLSLVPSLTSIAKTSTTTPSSLASPTSLLASCTP